MISKVTHGHDLNVTLYRSLPDDTSSVITHNVIQ